MDPSIVLFILRLLAALLLLTFLGVVSWLMYQDLMVTRLELAGRERRLGSLLVVRSEVQPEPAQSTFPLLPVTSIGRSPNNTVVLEDDFASGAHALLMLRGEQWWLEDLNSRNGTLLNGVPLQEATVISAGDVITIGNTRLKIEPTA
jgi:hypothetical protein